MTEPFRILGAGPAGLTAAITLARAGHAVQVFERGSDCGARFHGDLQGLENWTAPGDVVEDLATMGIEIDFACDPFHSAVHTNGRRARTLVFDRPAFYLVRRGTAADSLDQGLKRQALAAGATIRWGETLAPEQADIVATGPDTRRLFAIDKGIVFETDAPDMAVVLTTERAAIKGYSYLLVSRGHGCLCTVLFDRFREARECYVYTREMLLRQYPVQITHPRPVGGIGHFSGRSRFQQGATLFVGEAAGLQDLLWGFGIRSAVTSAHLAARCLLEGRDYEAAAQAAFGSHLRAGVVNRFLWEALRHGDYNLLMYILARGGLGLLHSFYGYNLLQRLLYPGARLFVQRRYPALHF